MRGDYTRDLAANLLVQLPSMRIDQFSQVFEARVGFDLGWVRSSNCCTRTINPHLRQTDRFGWCVIVKQALGNMENVAFGVTEVAQPRQQIVEIAPVGFVGADVLCGIDGVEVNAEFAVAGCEALAIDV